MKAMPPMPEPIRTETTKGILACLVAATSFGLMFPVMASALKRVDPFTFTSLRYLTAAVASLVVLLMKEGPQALRVRGESIGRAWLLGSLGFAGFGFLVFLGQQLAGRDGALMTSIMAATQPLLGVLILAVVNRALPPLATLGFIVLSFCGVILVVTRGDVGGFLNAPQNYAANLLILLGMTCWMIYTFGAARFATWSPLRYTTLTMCLGLTTILAINAGLFAVNAIAVPSAADLVFIVPHVLYMGLIAGMVGVLCWNIGNKLLAPLNAALFLNMVPLVAFAVSALLGVLPTHIQIFGACVTIAALIGNNLYPRLVMRRTPTVSGRTTA